MGAVTSALAAAASSAGAEIITSAGVSRIEGDDEGAEVTWHDGSTSHTVSARFVLANVAPWVLRILMGEPDDAETKPQGAKIKIDLLLNRLRRLSRASTPRSVSPAPSTSVRTTPSSRRRTPTRRPAGSRR